MPDRPSRDFYEAQKAQKRRSLALLAVLCAFYIVTVLVLLFAGIFAVGIFSGRIGSRAFFRPLTWIPIAGAGLALGLAALQYFDARRNGPAYILKRLGARLPDIHDRYHRGAVEAVERLRIAAGLPQAQAMIIPDHTINAMALVESDGRPVVALTEGLLAEFGLDELEAVAAHELAHVARGDAALMTFVCALADFYERMMDSFRSKDEGSDEAPLPLSVVFMRLLSRFIGRERELLADAAAVELGRNPASLARALYKAHLKNSFVGDFHETYSPMFMVAPENLESGDPQPAWSGTHPPLMERIGILAGMAHEPVAEIIRSVWREQARRAAARGTEKEGSPASPPPRITGRKDGPADEAGHCPRCAVDLVEGEYEGVPIQVCPRCGGKLVREEAMDRILIRRERGFGRETADKAADYRERFVRNPLHRMKLDERTAPLRRCPACGYRLAARPFNYQYFVPVDRCLSCGRIWFDADELEVLQVLVEEARGSDGLS
jgi:Zn-dependent protease with chaperone function/Zn-finger nucleic acid-binding protein